MAELICTMFYHESEGLFMDDSAFNTIILIRTKILPPYTYDEDEDERDITEYIEYFKENIDMSISTTAKYIDAISCFKNNKIDLNFKQILKIRKLFIKFLPFACDELEAEDEEFGIEFMRKIFENDSVIITLEQDLKEYFNALLKIKDNC